jgi:hypothetical protein
VFSSPRNIFGLFRRYYSPEPPSHDPEDFRTLADSSNLPSSAPPDPDRSSAFFPYPNETSLKLGDWYWNQGLQKSQESFKKLTDIVGDDSFRPLDVRDTKWDQINKKLASDASDRDREWLDEDAGWRKAPIMISVPFNRNMAHPGPREYTIADFYYRSLVDVIREKLSHQTDNRYFHYEPYELYWQPRDDAGAVRVYGELYTSPAFLEAHDELQESPGESNCDLPRIVVALMFSSDTTHPTSSGNAKLWPLYMYFGNDSKYRRCKPSSHLCCHVAYFKNVCISAISYRVQIR